MESFPLRTVEQDEYNPFTSVSIIFYCYNAEGSIEFLLNKNPKDDKYQEIRDTILESDSTSILAAARLLMLKFRGYFSSVTIQRLMDEEKILEDELVPAGLTFYQMWEHPLFFESIRKLLENSITIDSIHGKTVFLLELPKISVDNLNELFETEFAWVSNDSLQDLKQTDTELIAIANKYNLPSYIQTAGLMSDSDKETYIIMSCKPVDKATAVDPMYLHFPALFEGIFKRNGENWIYFNAAADEFPTEEQMKNAKAVIIPGSSASVYDRVEGIEKLKNWIRDFDKKYPTVKMLGICFGAQIICESLGGKVGKMEARKKDPDYYLVTSEILKAKDEWFELPFVKKNLIEDSKRLCVVEAHGDEIKELPRGFRNMASSNTCRNEIAMSESGRYLALQGHPEYTPEFIAAKSAMCAAQKKSETQGFEELEAQKNNFLQNSFIEPITADSLRAICYSFLKLNL